MRHIIKEVNSLLFKCPPWCSDEKNQRSVSKGLRGLKKRILTGRGCCLQWGRKVKVELVQSGLRTCCKQKARRWAVIKDHSSWGKVSCFPVGLPVVFIPEVSGSCFKDLSWEVLLKYFFSDLWFSSGPILRLLASHLISHWGEWQQGGFSEKVQGLSPD